MLSCVIDMPLSFIPFSIFYMWSSIEYLVFKLSFNCLKILKISFFSFFGWIKKSFKFLPYVSLLFFFNGLLALFHVFVEQKWIIVPGLCDIKVSFDGSLDDIYDSFQRTPHVPCDRVQWSFLGLSMAGYNVVFSMVYSFFIGFYVRQSKSNFFFPLER